MKRVLRLLCATAWALLLVRVQHAAAQLVFPDLSDLGRQIVAGAQLDDELKFGIVMLPHTLQYRTGSNTDEEIEALKSFLNENGFSAALSTSGIADALRRSLLTTPFRRPVSTQEKARLDSAARELGIPPEDIRLYNPERINRYGKLAKVNYLLFVTARLSAGDAAFQRFFRPGGTVEAILTGFSVTGSIEVEVYRVETGLQESQPLQRIHYQYGPEHLQMEVRVSSDGKAIQTYTGQPVIHPATGTPVLPVYTYATKAVRVDVDFSGSHLQGRWMKIQVRVLDPAGRPLTDLWGDVVEAEKTVGPDLQNLQQHHTTLFLERMPFKWKGRQLRRRLGGTGKDAGNPIKRQDFALEGMQFVVSVVDLSPTGRERKELLRRIERVDFPPGWTW